VSFWGGRALTRRGLLRVGAAGGLGLLVPPRLLAAVSGGALVTGIAVANEAVPFEGDGPLLTTLSPGGLRGRNRALVRFRLARPATVRLDVVDRNDFVTELPSTKAVSRAVHSQELRLQPGTHELDWEPAPNVATGTYIFVLTTKDATGTKTVVGRRGPQHPKLPRGPVVRVIGIDASFAKRSYRAGERASLLVAADTAALAVQVYRSGTEGSVPTYANNVMNGTPVGDPLPIDWQGNPDRRAAIDVTLGDWTSGVYFARLEANGVSGFAPFVVRPDAPRNRVAVVMPTNTWGAYNFYDADGDGYGDSWYVGWKTRTIDLTRPNLHRGVPYRYRSYDLAFVKWLAQTGKQADFYSDDDMNAFPSGDVLRASYDLVVFPGHTEYVTNHVYDVIQRFRDAGGNLMFLSANNFFRKVAKNGDRLTLVGLWRELGRPEAGLLGVQYRGNDRGTHQTPFVVTADGAGSWAFEGTGLEEGATFGRYGIEVDARASSSPPGTQVLAQIPNALGVNGLNAEMTYYEAESGARVFSAGVLNFGGQMALWPESTRLVANVWARLAGGQAAADGPTSP
jgi:hypothetical protein